MVLRLLRAFIFSILLVSMGFSAAYAEEGRITGISIEPMAHRFRKGSRVRLELVNGDSTITDVLWTHYYSPSKMGTDTVWHTAQYPSALTLPVTEGA